MDCLSLFAKICGREIIVFAFQAIRNDAKFENTVAKCYDVFYISDVCVDFLSEKEVSKNINQTTHSKV